MNTQTAMNTATKPVIFTVSTETKTVQIMSDVWDDFPFVNTTELVNGEFVFNSEILRGEKPEVNFTEADKETARRSLRKKANISLLNAIPVLMERIADAGCFVEVVRGRKVAKGTRGIIKKSGVSQFGKWFLIRTREGKEVFVSADNCEVESPLTLEQVEMVAKDASRTGIDRAVETLSFALIQTALDDARMAVNRTQRAMLEGRLFWL